MTVPYIYPLTEARTHLSHLVKAMVTGESGPALMGQHGRPQAALLAWDLFDHMRDLLSELEILRALPTLQARITHPSGVTTAPLSALIPTTASQEPISFWPDVVADLRAVSSPVVITAVEGVAEGTLGGQTLPDETSGDHWTWHLVTKTDPGAHFLVWRDLGETNELVAVLPADDVVARAWQPAPEPDNDEDSPGLQS